MPSGLARSIPAAATPIAVFLKNSRLEIGDTSASLRSTGIVSRFTGRERNGVGQTIVFCRLPGRRYERVENASARSRLSLALAASKGGQRPELAAPEETYGVTLSVVSFRSRTTTTGKVRF